MKKIALVMMILTFLLGACTTLQPAIPAQPTQPAPQPTQPGTAEIANPASVNCVNQGGTLKIETKPDGSQYGVCLFEDNLQCEEWTMMRGNCPVGGIKVTGYVTPAATYCAITGGTYTVTGESNTDNEQGTCTLVDGTVCDVWDYFNDKCSAGNGGIATTSPTPTSQMTIQPLPMESCDGLAQAMAHEMEVLVGSKVTTPIIPTQSEEALNDPVNNASGIGCMSTITGTGELYESPNAVVMSLGSMLVSEGWTEDPMLASGGPTGIGAGYRKDNQISLAAALWTPDPSANCPADQPVSACQVTPAQQDYTITLNTGEEVAVGSATNSAGMANPASVNCTQQGGTLTIETKPDGSQYGVCYFEDNRQCEEWALYHGDCPVGGLKITGYITPAAQYCAITGGTYTITGNNGADDEQGTCTLKNGNVCDVWDYYNGKCN